MHVLVIGTGMQGRAALHHLAGSPDVTAITAADRHVEAARQFAEERGYASRVTWASVDARHRASLEALFASRPDVAIDLLPVPFIGSVAHAAVEAGVPLVNTFYVTPELRSLDPAARQRGVTLLPELGMDPGIDLLLLGDAARRFDQITEIACYGAGIPEPAAADNPLKYKISWTFEGVLRSYLRSACLVEEGRVIHLPDTAQFAPEHGHMVAVDEVGLLEAFPNGDVLPYLQQLGVDPSGIRRAGRYAMRYPGHSAFWKTMVDLHLLDDDAVLVDGVAVNRRRFLAAALEPQLQYAPGERDLGILRVEVAGSRGGIRSRVMHQVVDRLDLRTGLSAMSRLVGFTASIGAQMIVRGDIRGGGIRSPLVDVPFAPFARALADCGITITTTESAQAA
ncbi:MAG: saccharopine dehydrogenase NADP-binding domain-containing protein [Acidobacteria bacterium]|nr:saccharopine dehydrogenase NADP-binding domain-containing protein [Acidobacteriota bacterium]